MKNLQLLHTNGLPHEAQVLLVSSSDPTCCWLTASPDRHVEDPTEKAPSDLVEVKCSFSVRDCTIDDVALDRRFFLESTEGGGKQPQRNHREIFQIRAKMALPHARWYDFAVWTMKNIFYQTHEIESTFPNLTAFCLTRVLSKL